MKGDCKMGITAPLWSVIRVHAAFRDPLFPLAKSVVSVFPQQESPRTGTSQPGINRNCSKANRPNISLSLLLPSPTTETGAEGHWGGQRGRPAQWGYVLTQPRIPHLAPLTALILRLSPGVAEGPGGSLGQWCSVGL